MMAKGIAVAAKISEEMKMKNIGKQIRRSKELNGVAK